MRCGQAPGGPKGWAGASDVRWEVGERPRVMGDGWVSGGWVGCKMGEGGSFLFWVRSMLGYSSLSS